MAKVVVQSTFDDIVLENIQDLELEPEEAIKDAIEQLTAQGIDLRNIVTDLVITDDGSSWHPIINLTRKLKENAASKNLSTDVLLPNLESFQAECNKTLAHRCLAAKEGGVFLTFMDLIASADSDSDLYVKVLTTFETFLNGQPDHVTPNAITKFISLMKSEKEEICLSGVRLVKISCLMHETNRQSFVAENLIPECAHVLKTHRSNKEIISETCLLLKVLTFDDDPRVPFGKSHDHAKMIVTEANALELLLGLAKDEDDHALLGDIFATLGRLAVRNEFCQRIVDLGGLQLMLDALHANLTSKVICTQIIGVLKSISGNDEVKVAIARSNAPTYIIEAMDHHQTSEALCSNSCACLASVALRNPDNVKIIMKSHGHMAIVQCMKVHPISINVQKQACMALRNLVVRSRENTEPILALGAEELICKSLSLSEEVADEAKAALRDLGCKVELKERWTGTKGSIQY